MTTVPATRLRALIVDDEPPARDRLRRMLGEHTDVDCVGEAGDGEAALAAIEALRPDVVFLDVQMPELDGLGVAAALGEDGPAVVFATAHDEHALRAFDLAAVDYLLKPIARERLAKALERVRAGRDAKAADVAQAVLARLAANAPRRMAVRCGAKYAVFDPDRVAAVVAQDHYATIFVDGKELLSEESLDRLMTRFDPGSFVRVHRSAILNIVFVKELEQEGDRKYVAALTAPNTPKIPIARDRLDAVKARLGIA
jgi:two-component system LytT family response regulator